jgi:hypothetical protein
MELVRFIIPCCLQLLVLTILCPRGPNDPKFFVFQYFCGFFLCLIMYTWLEVLISSMSHYHGVVGAGMVGSCRLTCMLHSI